MATHAHNGAQGSIRVTYLTGAKWFDWHQHWRDLLDRAFAAAARRATGPKIRMK